MSEVVESWCFRMRTDGGPGQDVHGVVVLDGAARFDVILPHEEVKAALARCHPTLDPAELLKWMLVDRILNPDHEIVSPGWQARATG
jgi:hypothetical protein